MAVTNPRFPHTCRIYRIEGETSFSDSEEETILYEGECRKEGNTSVRTFKDNEVYKADYRMNIPDTVEGILAGDYVDVTDRSGTFEKCIIAYVYAGNLGTTVLFNIANN